MRLHRRLSKLFSSLFVFATTLGVGYGTWVVEDKEEETSSKVPTNTDVCAVCYNGSTSTKYTTIEKALSEANSGEEILVIPNLKNSDGTIYTVNIKSNCTVKEGVTLSLPYQYTVTEVDKTTSIETTHIEQTCFNENNHGSAGFADATIEKVNTNRQTLVVVSRGYSLEVKGTLNIGGTLGSPNIGLSGQTSGSYCEIDLESSASIVCDGGNINCYGYIKRASENANASLSITNNGVLLTPFIIYDFKGGNKTVNICNLSDDKKYCPFQVFDLCNIQVKTTIESGSFWKARALLYISTLKYYVPATVNFISSETSNTALILKEGTVALDCVSNSFGITTADSHKTTIDINGKAQLGSLNMTVSIATIDASKFFFPISYLIDFNINKNAVLDVPNKVKLMNGSNLTIKEGGTLNLTNSLSIYDGFTDIETDYRYNSFTDATYATLINNGTINVTDNGGIGGYIDTTSETGILNYLTTNYEIKSPEYAGSFSADAENYQTQVATGVLTTDETSFASNSISCNYFSSVKNPTDTSAYGWSYKENAVVLIGIKSTASDQTTTCGSNTIEAVIYNESSSTATYNWSFDTNSVAEEDKDKISLEANGQTAVIKNASDNDYTIPVTVKMTDSLNIERTMTSSFSVKAKTTSGAPTDITGISFEAEKKVDGETDYSKADSDNPSTTFGTKFTQSFYSGVTTTNTKTDGTEESVYYKLKVKLDPQDGYFENLQCNWSFTQRSSLITKYSFNGIDDLEKYSSTTSKTSNPNSGVFTVYFSVGINTNYSDGKSAVTGCYLQAQLSISYTNSKSVSTTLPTKKTDKYTLKFFLISKAT